MNCHDSKVTILVVEDNGNLRRLLVRMLAQGGFAAMATGKAADGLAMVRERHGSFDLVIADIVMPKMSGLDLATDLDREYPELPILYISGYVNSVAADVLSRRSPEHMLLKPFSREVLLERVRALLDAPKRLDPASAATPTPSASPAQRDGTRG